MKSILRFAVLCVAVSISLAIAAAPVLSTTAMVGLTLLGAAVLTVGVVALVAMSAGRPIRFDRFRKPEKTIASFDVRGRMLHPLDHAVIPFRHAVPG